MISLLVILPRYADASPETPQAVRPHEQGEPKMIFSGGVQSNWNTKQWNARRTYGWKGPSGGDAFCGEVDAYGAIGLESHGGDFSNKVSMEIWIWTRDGVPDVKLQLLGHKVSTLSTPEVINSGMSILMCKSVDAQDHTIHLWN